MKTYHLLLGNSERLLSNFMEVLTQDACADQAVVAIQSVRTVEGLILQGLTGRFDLMVVVVNNLVPDRTFPQSQDAFAEAADAIRLVKKRCGLPVLAIAAFTDRLQEEALLRRAGADRLLELPFHPHEFASTVWELLKPAKPAVNSLEQPWDFPRSVLESVSGLRSWASAQA